VIRPWLKPVRAASPSTQALPSVRQAGGGGRHCRGGQGPQRHADAHPDRLLDGGNGRGSQGPQLHLPPVHGSGQLLSGCKDGDHHRQARTGLGQLQGGARDPLRDDPTARGSGDTCPAVPPSKLCAAAQLHLGEKNGPTRGPRGRGPDAVEGSQEHLAIPDAHRARAYVYRHRVPAVGAEELGVRVRVDAHAAGVPRTNRQEVPPQHRGHRSPSEPR
ncbi:unnamed protein product, partial [Ectocarpus sp. 13 AM-2016]